MILVFVFVCHQKGNAREILDTTMQQRRKRKKKKCGKRYRRRQRIVSSPWWPCPPGPRSSSRSAVSATWRHRLLPQATVSAKGGETRIAIRGSGGKGVSVTFGGIKQGGVELLPPQQIRARHGSVPVRLLRLSMLSPVGGGRAAQPQRRLEGRSGRAVGDRMVERFAPSYIYMHYSYLIRL